jgi:hypothetical protein
MSVHDDEPDQENSGDQEKDGCDDGVDSFLEEGKLFGKVAVLLQEVFWSKRKEFSLIMNSEMPKTQQRAYVNCSVRK